jgi:hypothetical protein
MVIGIGIDKDNKNRQWSFVDVKLLIIVPGERLPSDELMNEKEIEKGLGSLLPAPGPEEKKRAHGCYGDNADDRQELHA